MTPRTASRTDEAFPDALRGLIDQHGLSLRTLADLTPAVDGRGLRHAYLGHLTRGTMRPTVANMELLAQTFGVDPGYFREYRAHQAADLARQLAESLGADVVLAKLAELEE